MLSLLGIILIILTIHSDAFSILQVFFVLIYILLTLAYYDYLINFKKNSDAYKK